MATLAAGEALGAGFRVIRQAPGAFAVWLGIDIGLSLLPQLALGVTGAGAAGPAAVMGVLPLLLLVSLLISVLITGAVFRAVLTPEDRRGFYVRLGGQELYLAIAFVSVGLLWLFGVIVLMLPVSVVITLIGAVGGGSLATTFLSFVLMYLAMFLVAAWVFLRLSLALPIAFFERKVGIREAWGLSRGHVLNMFGVWLVLFLLMAVVYLVLFGLMFGSVFASVPLGQLGQAIEDDPALLSRSMNPAAAVVTSLGLVLAGGVLRVAFAGAWAHIYRQLTAKPAAEVFA